MRKNKRWFPLTPECCKKIKQSGTVTLCIPMIWYEGKETKSEDWKWVTTGIDEDSWNTKRYEAEFCPHCGKRLPAFRVDFCLELS